MYQSLKPALIGAAALLAAVVPAAAQEIAAVKDGIHVIMGKGGNIGVSSGPDGVFMIDDQFAPATEAILGKIKSVTDQPVRFLLNTHHHRDHTGGNENLGKAGVLIFAHDNVRARLLATDAPASSLPVVTFNDTTTFNMNGQTIHVFHTQAAHTDGDAMIQFREANVIHMGDTFFNGFYPFIDSKSGGSVEGVFAAIDKVLSLADANTVIIPGHGPIGDRDDLMAYRDMLTKAKSSITPLIADGKSVEDIVVAKPTAEFDAGWGGGFLNPERFIRVMHAALTK
jgi:glyoxylase-like metal-dependent hydrolase (beta-lactamase superfamily II)